MNTKRDPDHTGCFPAALSDCLACFGAPSPRFLRRIGVWSEPMPQHCPGLGQAFRKVLGVGRIDSRLLDRGRWG